MERAVRKSKQELVALDEALKNVSDDKARIDLQLEFNAVSVKLKGQEAKLSDFCSKTGLDRDRYREQVFAAKTEREIRGFGKSTSMRAVHSAKRYYSNFLREYNIDEPKTLDKYYKMKYNNSPEYRMLKRYTHMVDKGEVSPIMGFRYYHDRAKDIENNLIGLTTSNGIEIKDYSDHFVARMIGYSGLEDKFKQKRYNRPGVTIEEIRDCLTQGKTGKTQEHEKAGKSVVFFDGKISVTVNPTTGSLVQTNRNGG